MLVATWNVNSLKARLPRVLEFIETHAPDLLCLQETKCAPDAFPLDELAAAGYAAAHHSGGRWAGVAVLAREETVGSPVDVTLGLPGEAAPDEARWVEATVAGLRVVSTYVTNGREVDSPTFAEKLTFFDAAASRARTLRADGKTPVVVGDFNVCPTDADVYDPEAFAGSTHVTAAERDAYQAVLDVGLVDAYRHLHPDEPQFTWWDYRQGHFHKGLGLRIDLALVDTTLAGTIKACGIDRTFRKGTKPSDHAPLLLTLDQLIGVGPKPHEKRA